MFKIYDLDYNEVRFPVDDLGFGLKSLDISIGPIIYENIYTQSSRADQLVKRYPKDRTVSINAMFTSHNKNVADWRLKRDVIYEFFRTLEVFYVAEEYQPFKLLKVIVDADYMPDRPVNIWGMLEIPLKIIDTPFKQSLHTTMDIDREGISWNNKWAYGMGLSSDKAQWKYSFTNTNPRFFNAGSEDVKLIRQKESEVTLTFKTDVNSSPPSSATEKITPVFELGGWGSQGRKITGSNPVTIRSTTALQIKSGMVTSTKSSNIYQYEYIIRSSDVEEFDGNVDFYVDRTGKIDFGTRYIAPADNYYYLAVNRKDGAAMSEADLNNIRSLFNPIEYDADANRIEIYDGETTFTLNRSVKNGDVLKLEGHKVLLNGNNVQSDTNFNFLTVRKGWNNWEIRGVSNFEFKIDYRFLYD